ncbi:MAG: hypothetical protein ACOH10_08035 [Rhodoglobus sp.]
MPAFVPVVYSGGAPVLRSDGQTQREACPDLAEWLLWRDALEVARGRGHIVYYQTQGDSPDSKRTHLDGSAADRKHTSTASVMDSREMGMAEYPRITKYGWTGAQHDHGMIPCGHNTYNRYQWTAYLNGWNGLGLGGQAAGDPLPRPAKIRTWQQGIVWAKAEIARLNGTTPEPQEEDMDSLIFMRVGVAEPGVEAGTIFIIRPGSWPRRLTPQEWALYVRLGAQTPGGDFLRAEVDIVAAGIGANDAALTGAVTATIDPAVLTAAVKAAVAGGLDDITFTTRKALA